jgi:hypothetical protein
MNALVKASAKILALVAVSASYAQAATIDQESGDTTVLKAFNTRVAIGVGSGAQPIDVNQCEKLEDSETYANFDCSRAIESMIAASHPDIVGPVIGRIIVRAERPSADYAWQVNQYFCRLLEIQTVTRNVALQSAEGIGFSYNGSPSFSALEKLVAIGTVTLRNGETATLHRFQAPAFCWRGSVTSSSRATYDFKPFLQFTAVNGDVFRNWDSVPQNYAVGRVGFTGTTSNGSWIEGFDRSAEVLAQ